MDGYTGKIFGTHVTDDVVTYFLALMAKGDLPKKLFAHQVEVQKARWEVMVPATGVARLIVHPLSPEMVVSHEFACHVMGVSTDSHPEETDLIDVRAANGDALIPAPFDAAVLDTGDDTCAPVDWGMVEDDRPVELRLRAVGGVERKVVLTMAYAVRPGKHVADGTGPGMRKYSVVLTASELATIMWMAGQLERTKQLHDPHRTIMLGIIGQIQQVIGKPLTLEEIVEILNEADAEAFKSILH